MELRQLRYFVVLAEELHFGRAAAREHIVQSALSQQLQRLERELGAALLYRTTHHVQLTPVGSALLAEARQILAHVDRAVVAAKQGAGLAPALRVCIADPSYDSMPQILRQVRERYPALRIHQVEAGVPEQLRRLADGRLDVGLGPASAATPEVAAELFRLDPMGVLLPPGHRLAAGRGVAVADLADERLLLLEGERAREFNQFVLDLCRSAGLVPRVYAETVESLRGGVDLIAQGRCVACSPLSSVSALPELVWRPFVKPESYYPWSVLWRAADRSEHVAAVRAGARALSRERGWLPPLAQLAV